MASEPGHRYTHGAPAGGWPTFGPDGRVVKPSLHEPIPYCDGSGRDACVACSEAVDRCVPWPCEVVVHSEDG